VSIDVRAASRVEVAMVETPVVAVEQLSRRDLE
jgi:hypothetical protein